MEWIGVVIGFVGLISGALLGWSGRAREARKEVVSETKEDAETVTAMKADIAYIKVGIDDIRFEERAHGKELKELGERVTRAEESVKSAHHRLDELNDKKI